MKPSSQPLIYSLNKKLHRYQLLKILLKLKPCKIRRVQILYIKFTFKETNNRKSMLYLNIKLIEIKLKFLVILSKEVMYLLLSKMHKNNQVTQQTQ